MYSEKTSRQVTEKVLARLVAGTDITATSPGTMARTLTELISQELGQAYTYMSESLQQAYVSTAGGEALDRLGLMVGMTRKTVNPVINSSTGSVFFYLTLADEEIVPGSATQFASANVVIPTGTVIGADPLRLGSDDPNLFKVTSDVTIIAGAFMAYASVEPFNAVKQTMPAAAAKYHNYIPAVTPVNASSDELAIHVFNRTELQTNTSIESDSNFRFRIINALSTTAGSTALSLRLAALGVTGVRDCKVYPLAHGVGTAKAVVVLENLSDSVNALTVFQNAVQAIQAKASVGDVLDIVRPTESPVSMKLLVTFSENKVDDEILARAEFAAKAYINSLSVGDRLSLSRLYGTVASLSPKIVDVKVVDGTFTVDLRNVIASDYTCADDQQLYAADVVAV